MRTFGNLALFFLFSVAGFGQAAPQLTASQITFPVLTTLAQPSGAIALVGNPGPQTYFYWLVANYPLGPLAPVLVGSLPYSPAVLSSGNYNQIVPTYPTGVTSLDLLRTTSAIPPIGACACAVSAAVTAGAINDQSNSLSAYTVQAQVNVNALAATLTNEVVSAGTVHLLYRQNGSLIADLAIGGSGGSGNVVGPGVSTVAHFVGWNNTTGTLTLDLGFGVPIPLNKLAASSITVTAGTGLSGGGSVSLGGSTTLNINNPAAINITGNAATATQASAAPSLCPSGQAAQGILQNFNAGGCFTPVGSGTVNTPGASNELAIYNSVTNAVFGSPNINFAPGSPGTLNVNGNVSADQYTGVGAYSVASTLPSSSPTPSSIGLAGFAVGTDGNFYLSPGNNSSTTSGPYQVITPSPLTTNGDLYTYGSGANARLGIGGNGDFLYVTSGLPGWNVNLTDSGTLLTYAGVNGIQSLSFAPTGVNPNVSIVAKGGKGDAVNNSTGGTSTTTGTTTVSKTNTAQSQFAAGDVGKIIGIGGMPATAPTLGSATQTTGGSLTALANYCFYATDVWDNGTFQTGESPPSNEVCVTLTGSNNKITFPALTLGSGTPNQVRLYMTDQEFVTAITASGGTSTCTSAPALTITGGGATAGAAQGQTTISGGNINGTVLFNTGFGYTTTPSVTVTAGTSGCTGSLTGAATISGNHSEVGQGSGVCSSAGTRSTANGACDSTSTFVVTTDSYIAANGGFLAPTAGTWVSTIATFVDNNHVTIADQIPADVTGNTNQVGWGTDNTSALSAALALLPTASTLSSPIGGTILFDPTGSPNSPTGRYLFLRGANVLQGGVKLIGGSQAGNTDSGSSTTWGPASASSIAVVGRTWGVQFGSSTVNLEGGGLRQITIEDLTQQAYGGDFYFGAISGGSKYYTSDWVTVNSFLNGYCHAFGNQQKGQFYAMNGAGCPVGFMGMDANSATEINGGDEISNAATTGLGYGYWFRTNPLAATTLGNNKVRFVEFRDYYQAAFRISDQTQDVIFDPKFENIDLVGGGAVASGGGGCAIGSSACFGTYAIVDSPSQVGTRCQNNMVMFGTPARTGSIIANQSPCLHTDLYDVDGVTNVGPTQSSNLVSPGTVMDTIVGNGYTDLASILNGQLDLNPQATGVQALIANNFSGTTVDIADFQTNGTTQVSVGNTGIIGATTINLGVASTTTGSVILHASGGSGSETLAMAPGSTTGTWTTPNVNDTAAGVAATQTLTNKSIQMGQLTGATAAATVTETAVVRPLTYAGVETAALTYPWVFSNANSSTNNSSGALLVGTTGTSTGAVPVVVNEGTSAGDLLDMYNGGTVSAGAISGGTKEYGFGPTGVLTLGASAPGITTNGTTPYFNMNTLVQGAVNKCAPTSAVTLSGTTAIICTWTLPNAAKTWFWQCSGTYSITAGTTPGLTLQMNAAQAPTNETGQAIIGSLAASGAITQTFQTGLGTSTSAGAQTIFADSPTVAITTVANAPWSTSGSIQASATSGTFAIQALLSGTGTPAGTINVGSGCTIQ